MSNQKQKVKLSKEIREYLSKNGRKGGEATRELRRKKK